MVASLPSSAIACSCERPLTPSEAIESAVAVFSGKVIDDDAGFPWRKVKFSVERFWKGSLEENIIISTGSLGANCGYPFEKGERYLVYASSENLLGTNSCSRTRPITYADEYLSILGKGQGLGKPMEEEEENVQIIKLNKKTELTIEPKVLQEETNKHSKNFHSENKEIVADENVLINTETATKKAVEKMELAFVQKVEKKEINNEIIYEIIGTIRTRLLFVIPVHYKVNIIVNAINGDVKLVQKPWWSFLII